METKQSMEISGESALRSWAEALYAEHGRLTPGIVLDAARPPDSPAHAHIFNASPGEAAEMYYLERAHALIRRIRVTVVTQPEQPPRRLRYYHAIPGGEDAAYEYHPLGVLLDQPDKLELARNEAMRRLKDAERAVEDFDVIVSDAKMSRKTKRALTAIRDARMVLAD
jgi:hypothetical protein